MLTFYLLYYAVVVNLTYYQYAHIMLILSRILFHRAELLMRYNLYNVFSRDSAFAI